MRVLVLSAILLLAGTPASGATRAGFGAPGVPGLAAGAKRIVVCLDGTWNNPYREKERYD